MERESFENDEIAQLMNELFVNIKVDREERPDVDEIYMDAVQMMTGHGRLADDRVPHARRRAVLRRHVFPAEPRQGMPGFPQVLDRDQRRVGRAAREIARAGGRDRRAAARRGRADAPERS